MTNIEKIRQEIERRKKEFMHDSLASTIGRYYEDRDILAFIDSLPEEKPSDDLEEAAEEYASDGSIGFIDMTAYNIDMTAYNAFIAGAEWQKEQDKDYLNEELIKAHLNGVMTGDRIAMEESQMPLPEDTVIFQKGVAEGRRLERDDLALTWQDMAKIDAIILDVNNEFAVDYSKEIDRQKFYEEVLSRFNKV